MLDFNLVPQVAVDFMNEDHRHFTALLNRLEALLDDAGSDNGAVTAVLSEIVAHCREHFGREERQMEQYRFPPYPVHKGEHERVLAQLDGLQRQWQTTEARAPLAAAVTQITEWFINHAATMDTVTASYIVRMGGPAPA